MDLNAIPRDMGMDIEKWAHLLKTQGVLFYDGTKGDKPTFKEEDTTIKMYDVKEENSMRELESILMEEGYMETKHEEAPSTIPEAEYDITPRVSTNVGPLTGQEINQLGIVDPNPVGENAIDSGLSDEENNLIDSQMRLQEEMVQVSGVPASRSRRQLEPGFTLTDDTND